MHTAMIALAAVLTSGMVARAATTQVRGKIEAVEGHTLTIQSRDGGTVGVKLNDPASVMAVKAVDASAIAPGTYVGIAAEPNGKDGYRAQEVLVFPEAMRGAGEGHYAWDLTSGSSMTNGSVSGVVEAQSGRTLHVTYKGQSTSIAVPPGTPIVTLVPAEWADVRPGTPVFIIAMKQPDGTLTASRITVGKDGVAPPM